jgi:hypothetical protein
MNKMSTTFSTTRFKDCSVLLRSLKFVKKTKVVADIVVAIKEIVLNSDLMNKKYYELLLGYFTSLCSFNYHRLDELSEVLQSFFGLFSNIRNEFAVKFGTDFLGFLANLSFRNYLSQTDDSTAAARHLANINFCMRFINELVDQKSARINGMVLRVYEGLIDKNGYEIPVIFWRVILERLQQILLDGADEELGGEVAKFGDLISA